MLTKPTAYSWSESNSTSLHHTQCGSVGLGIEDAAIALTLLEHHQESQQNQRSQEPTS